MTTKLRKKDRDFSASTLRPRRGEVVRMDGLRRQSRKSQGVERLARADRVDFSPCLDRRHHEREHHQEDQEAVARARTEA